MDIDQYRAPHREQFPTDYWDIPEVAALLRIVTHINIGGTLALCLWVAMLVFGSGGKSIVTGDITLSQHGCKCKQMVLVPIPAGKRQLVNLNEVPRS